MLLFITGSSGFLGRYVVAEALRQGHRVRAVVRPASDATCLLWHDHSRVELAHLDLRSQKGIADALTGVDKVIHLAAVKGGDFYERFAGSVLTTENLLAGMVAAGVYDMVAISTFSVYDYLRIGAGSDLTEESPVESSPKYRDEYAQTKLIQEQLIRDFEQEHQARVVYIRPGMVYGREDLWHVLLGFQIGRGKWLCVGPRARMPMTYVENSAEAVIAAAQTEAAVGKTINIVDDDPPRRTTYMKMLSNIEGSKLTLIPVPWFVADRLAALAWFVNRVFLKGRARLPSPLIPARLHARFKPLNYNNILAKRVLDWAPRYSLEESLKRSVSEIPIPDMHF